MVERLGRPIHAPGGEGTVESFLRGIEVVHEQHTCFGIPHSSCRCGRWFLAFTLSVAVALDNALLSQAHFALSDSILITLCLVSILVFVDLYSRALNATRASLFVWVIWGVLTAAAALVELTGAFVLILVTTGSMTIKTPTTRRL